MGILVDTWDRANQSLLAQVVPHPNVYYLFGLLSRFTALRSSVLGCSIEGGSISGMSRVFAAALRSAGGDVTLLVVNDAPQAWNMKMSIHGKRRRGTLYRYQVCPDQRDRSDLRVEPAATFSLRDGKTPLRDSLPPSSVTVYSTYHRQHGDDGVIR